MPARLLLLPGLLPLCGILLGQAAPPSVTLPAEIELVRLVDLCADQLGIEVEYDPKLFQGAALTLRLSEPVEPDRLWDLASQLLVSQGLTTVQPPGREDAVLRVVRLTDAAATARVESRPLQATRAGYATIAIDLQHADPAELSKALQPLLSKAGGQLVQAGARRRLLVSDVKPRLELVLKMVAEFDMPAGEVRIEPIEARFRSATQLAALVTAAVTARNSLAGSPLTGKLTPSPDNDAVFLIAPAAEVEAWRSLIARFDVPAAVETKES